MKKNDQIRNLALISVILLVAIGFVTWFDQIRNKIVVGFPLDKIAIEFTGWEGTNMSVSKKEAGWVEQGDLIVRNYKKGEDIVYLVAIQERGERHRVHSPSDCYSGSGWVILKKDSVKFSDNRLKNLRRMHVVKNNVPRMVYYWFTNGEKQCASFKGHLALFLKDVILRGSIRSWVCFQISTDIKGNNEETEKILKDFISDLGV